MTYIYTLHTYIHTHAEEGVPSLIEEALNEIVKTTEKDGNMKKELKETIYENVSTLRNLFVKMKEKLEEGNRRKDNLEKENSDLKT